ncbi:Hypothetical protein HVR_LOCUS947 [uncultured virus]|nr:Hypothetical protein HVR_LOCUS947 [uncultured virus]
MTYQTSDNNSEHCNVDGCPKPETHKTAHHNLVIDLINYRAAPGKSDNNHIEKSEQCTIDGCGRNHKTDEHYCNVCFLIGADHIEKNCPYRCDVEGCDPNIKHKTVDHPCKICGKIGVDHIEKNCPERCTINNCKEFHQIKNHYCFICDTKGADHIEKNCPKCCTEDNCRCTNCLYMKTVALNPDCLVS